MSVPRTSLSPKPQMKTEEVLLSGPVIVSGQAGHDDRESVATQGFLFTFEDTAGPIFQWPSRGRGMSRKGSAVKRFSVPSLGLLSSGASGSRQGEARRGCG